MGFPGRVGWLAAPAMMWATTAFADPCEAPLPQPGTSFSGPVAYVGDGDSLCVATGPGPDRWVEVRLADFYAPELSTPEGRQAKAVLERLARGRQVTCRAGRRSYDRVVATCRLDGTSLGQRLRQAGVGEGGRR